MGTELPAAVPHQRLMMMMMMMMFGEIPKERFSVSIKVLQTQPLFTALIFHTGVIVIPSVIFVLFLHPPSPMVRSGIFKSLADGVFHPS